MATTTLTGEQLEEIKQQAADHFWPHARQAGNVSEDTGLKVVTGGQGVWVNDSAGEPWFDLIAGMFLKNIGHGRKEIADAVYEQMQGISYTPGGTVAPATAQLAARVAGLAPDKDSRVYFVSGGSEAVETALKMAKQYHHNNGESSRWKVISRKGSYHGATHACMSLGQSGGAVAQIGPLMPGNVHVANHDPYRGICSDENGNCALECVMELDRAIEHEGPRTVAAFIGEPISMAAGTHVPHPDYWPAVQEVCEKHGVIMICDEVITGFGPDGEDVRHGALGDTAGHNDGGEGADERIPADRGGDSAQGSGGRVHRGRRLDVPASHHVRREPGFVRGGAGQPGHNGG